MGSTHSIPILMYHHVEPPPPKGPWLRGLYVHPKSFQRQMKFLKSLGYQGLSMSELWPYLRSEKTGKVVGITFDDGYQSVFENAFPVLRKFGCRATCYVVSNLVGKVDEWNTPAGFPSKSLMNSMQLQHWVNAGMEVGSHTLSHPDLTSIPPAQAKEEIHESKRALESSLGIAVRHFSYPYGRYNDPVIQMVKEAGYASAVTVRHSRVRRQDPPLELPRVLVARRDYLPLFWMKITTPFKDIPPHE